ncbi:MAG: MBL fold metallo-hydrolase [Saprospiraceae bacterium]
MTLHALPINFPFNGATITLYPALLRSDTDLFLIDCGYAGSLPLLEAAAGVHGLSLVQLTGIIISHHDIDHVGGLFEMKSKYPQLPVYASSIEAKYISGAEKWLRLVQAEALYPSLPEAYQSGALQFQQMLEAVQTVPVDYTFLEYDMPIIWKDFQILYTPGHTPGHISIYLPAAKTLIAADAVVFENGILDIANPDFCMDLPQAIASVQSLQMLDIERILCYHGGMVEHEIPQLLQALVQRYQP